MTTSTTSPDEAASATKGKGLTGWFLGLPGPVQATIVVALVGVVAGGARTVFDSLPPGGRFPTPLPGPTPTLGISTCRTAHRFTAPKFASVSESTLPLLGTSTVARTPIRGSIQEFGAGLMLWREDRDVIYVFFPTGDWECYADAYDPIMPPNVCMNVTPPPTGDVPVLGFGMIWCACANVRRAINFGQGPERAIDYFVERFQKGEVIDGFDHASLHRSWPERLVLYRGERCQ